MAGRTPTSVAYLVLSAALWLVLLPGVLVADADIESIPFRHPLLVGLAVVAAAAGLGLVDRGARRLALGGVSLWSAVPGRVLVTDDVYGVVRNPIEIGIALMSLASWSALRLPLMWLVPAGSIAWLVAGIGPYEDRRLHETFGDEFDAYCERVRKWLPRR